MFADPQSLNSQTLPRVYSAENSGKFRLPDATHAMTVSHSYKKRTRHVVRYDHAKVAADPFTAGQSLRYSASVYLVVDAPLDGYTSTELAALVAAFTTNLTASTNANINKLVAGES